MGGRWGRGSRNLLLVWQSCEDPVSEFSGLDKHSKWPLSLVSDKSFGGAPWWGFSHLHFHRDRWEHLNMAAHSLFPLTSNSISLLSTGHHPDGPLRKDRQSPHSCFLLWVAMSAPRDALTLSLLLSGSGRQENTQNADCTKESSPRISGSHFLNVLLICVRG